MELFVKANSSPFINWLRSFMGELENTPDMSSVEVREKDYYFRTAYTPESNNKDIPTFDDPQTEGLTLHPCLIFTGDYIPSPPYIFDENTPKSELPPMDAIELGKIEIRTLGEERLQLVFDFWIPASEKLFAKIAQEIIRVWPLEPLPDNPSTEIKFQVQEVPKSIHSWDGFAIEQWRKNKSCKEIASALGTKGIEVDSKTVRNRLTILRKSLGREKVPLNQDRKRDLLG